MSVKFTVFLFALYAVGDDQITAPALAPQCFRLGPEHMYVIPSVHQSLSVRDPRGAETRSF